MFPLSDRTLLFNRCLNLLRQMSLRRLESIRMGMTPLVIVACMGTGCQRSNEPPSEEQLPFTRTPSLIDEAKEAMNADDTPTAVQRLTEHLIQEPSDTEAVWMLAQLAEEQGDLNKALELSESIASRNSPFVNEAATFSVDVALALKDDHRYELALRRWVDVTRDKAVAYDRLWKHLLRHGRTMEAAAIADRLVSQGQASRKHLMSLLFRGQSYPRPPEETNPNQPDWLEQHFAPGLGRARLYFDEGKFDLARDELEAFLADDATAESLDTACANALLGRTYAELQDDDQFVQWHANHDPPIEQHADYWSAIGCHHFSHREFESAVHALLVALQMNRTDLVNHQRLKQSLKAMDRIDWSDSFEARATLLNETHERSKELIGESHNIEALRHISQHLLQLGRPLESLSWTESSLSPSATTQRRQIAQQRKRLTSVPDLQKMMREDATLGLNPNDFAIKPISPSATSIAKTVTWNSPARKGLQIDIHNVASELELHFQWHTAETTDLSSIALYESLGGGVGVIDYDNDGRPDLYFAQGSGDPPAFRGTRTNQLFRNLGTRFESVETSTQTSDISYSQGIAVGDVNQDGWPDLLVGNIGRNRLFLNCGDGTFQDATERMLGLADRFTSSMAIADITGDALPDLFEVNYIQLEHAFDPPQFDHDGRELMQGPLSQLPQSDCWYRSNGHGAFVGEEISESIAASGTGLGVVITNMDAEPDMEVFIGNDARPNHLFPTHVGPSADVSYLRGVACGRFGMPTACMGIATGDFNRDGRFDIHISNFYGESDNLFLQTPSGVFRDAAPSRRLPERSNLYVGFGSKAIDVDADGWLDLVTTNGHIFDQSEEGQPFRQRPLLMKNESDSFSARTVSSTNYFDQPVLGRGLAKLDWNKDGRTDLVVTHLDAPAALLDLAPQVSGNWICLELIGCRSERDAIGAEVRIHTSHGRQVDWVTAGDGYLCSDEACLSFGIADCKQIQQVSVQWPSGNIQEWADLSANQRYLLIENCNEAFHR